MENNTRNKVEKLENTDLNEVSGGYVGKDWSQKSEYIYEKLGIEHKSHAFGYDEYFIGGKRIPKKYAYAVVDSYLSEGKIHSIDYYRKKRRESELNTHESNLQSFLELKDDIASGDDDFILNSIWQRYD